VSRTRAAVDEHVAAFNSWDSSRVLAGFAPDSVWVTGQDRFVGRAALSEVFDAGLWEIRPHLEVRNALVDGQSVALELVESYEIEGEKQVVAIAAFLDFDGDGLIRRGTVYREGNADF
jgi:ketosteroid isomerase-like protein